MVTLIPTYSSASMKYPVGKVTGFWQLHSLQNSWLSTMKHSHCTDRFVAAFFGITVPTFGTLEFRISGFVKNLMVIKSRYESWSQMPEITEILERIRQRHPGIARAHPVRICDFLVWTAGKNARNVPPLRGQMVADAMSDDFPATPMPTSAGKTSPDRDE